MIIQKKLVLTEGTLLYVSLADTPNHRKEGDLLFIEYISDHKGLVGYTYGDGLFGETCMQTLRATARPALYHEIVMYTEGKTNIKIDKTPEKGVLKI